MLCNHHHHPSPWFFSSCRVKTLCTLISFHLRQESWITALILLPLPSLILFFFSLGKTISGQTGRIFFLFLLLPFYLFSTLLIFPLLTSSFPCLHFSFFSPPLPSVFHSAFLFLLTSLISLPFHSSSFPLLPCSPVSSLCFHFPAKNSLRCSKQWMGPTFSGIIQEEGRAEEAGRPEQAGRGRGHPQVVTERGDALLSLGANRGKLGTQVSAPRLGIKLGR